MSDQGSVAEGEARAAEIRRDVEAADARRSEEDVTAAEQDVTEATEEQEKLSRRARRKREKAQKAEQAAQAARAQADETAAAARARADEAVAAADRRRAEQTSSVSGAAVSSPGIGSETPPHAAAAASAQWPRPQAGDGDSLTDRPEVLIGAAFAGAFIFARVLKHIVD